MDQPAVLNNRYKLIARLGAGGMANVWKAQDLALGRLVAVKILHDALTGDPEFLHRFDREAHAAANLTHPNVVTVHDVGQDHETHYIVMEYVDGEDLKTLIRREAPMPVERALDLAIQICAGIGYAHRAGFVHCDVKPQNVLITADGRVKVADFGIARALSSATLYTQTDMVWGSPHYFSPEQAAGEPPTPASDVYSIGVVLFEMLTGRTPFDADNPTALALMHLRDTPPLATQFNPQVPVALEQIITKLLAKEPAARYRTADQLARILESYSRQGHQSTQAQPPLPLPAPAQSQPAMDPPQAARPATGPVTPARPAPRPAPIVPQYRADQATPVPAVAQVVPAETYDEEELYTEPAGVDWLGIMLALVALLAVLGLIPLWWVVLVRLGAFTPAPAPLPSGPTGQLLLNWIAQFATTLWSAAGAGGTILSSV